MREYTEQFCLVSRGVGKIAVKQHDLDEFCLIFMTPLTTPLVVTILVTRERGENS
jgi:hypothetical protein